MYWMSLTDMSNSVLDKVWMTASYCSVLINCSFTFCHLKSYFPLGQKETKFDDIYKKLRSGALFTGTLFTALYGLNGQNGVHLWSDVLRSSILFGVFPQIPSQCNDCGQFKQAIDDVKTLKILRERWERTKHTEWASEYWRRMKVDTRSINMVHISTMLIEMTRFVITTTE